MSQPNCSVCGYDLGDAQDLQAQVAAAPQGYDTPADYGLDPDAVTWMCGTHTDDIGDPDWNEDVPYWHG